MPNGYWIGHVTVDDPAAYDACRMANDAAYDAHGGRFLVRGRAQGAVEGSMRPRAVVIEFPSVEAARVRHANPEYQAAKSLYDPASLVDLVIVEGGVIVE